MNNKNVRRYLIIFLMVLSIFLISCNKYDSEGYQKEVNVDYVSNQSEDAKVKNIILLIGDGMGVNHVEVTKSTLADGKKLDLESAEYTSMVSTYCLDNVVTDSAASATAMATGHKTVYKRLGMDENGEEVKNILEYANEKGLGTGIVTDEELFDATPAAFSSHVRQRYTYKNDILDQQVKSKIDLLIGFGDQTYCKYEEQIKENGFEYVNTKSKFNNTKSSKVFATFPVGDGYESEVPTLYEMADKAIEILSKNDKGFVLIVECGRIDGASHDGDIVKMTEQVKMLDKTLRVILNFMRSNDETMVIATADHETGGLVNGEGEMNNSWFTDTSSNTEGKHYHTPQDVKLYAFGTKSKIFDNKNIDNTDIFKIMKEQLGL